MLSEWTGAQIDLSIGSRVAERMCGRLRDLLSRPFLMAETWRFSKPGVLPLTVDSAPLALGWCIRMFPWALPKANDFAPLVLLIK
ncbi:hypothetical protein ADIS_2756 [Lunatimonas lonarensis]|uniref:Uncharacterized protein n=1 Tax=Lunatimonas lonarensis TaxID=1232681 RepID=R7ZRL4_9BACT|nr:hypothetical protein ADIS_2756 [Lunatimonas lonarensis]